MLLITLCFLLTWAHLYAEPGGDRPIFPPVVRLGAYCKAGAASLPPPGGSLFLIGVPPLLSFLSEQRERLRIGDSLRLLAAPRDLPRLQGNRVAAPGGEL